MLICKFLNNGGRVFCNCPSLALEVFAVTQYAEFLIHINEMYPKLEDCSIKLKRLMRLSYFGNKVIRLLNRPINGILS